MKLILPAWLQDWSGPLALGVRPLPGDPFGGQRQLVVFEKRPAYSAEARLVDAARPAQKAGIPASGALHGEAVEKRVPEPVSRHALAIDPFHEIECTRESRPRKAGPQ